MKMPFGLAPVKLHDLIHELGTHPLARPKPTTDKGEELRTIPVVVELYDETGANVLTTLAPNSWRLTRQGDGFALVIATTAPDFAAQTNRAIETIREDGGTVQSEPEAAAPIANGIPELAHLDPAIFAPNTKRPAGFGGKDRVPNADDNRGN